MNKRAMILIGLLFVVLLIVVNNYLDKKRLYQPMHFDTVKDQVQKEHDDLHVEAIPSVVIPEVSFDDYKVSNDGAFDEKEPTESKKVLNDITAKASSGELSFEELRDSLIKYRDLKEKEGSSVRNTDKLIQITELNIEIQNKVNAFNDIQGKSREEKLKQIYEIRGLMEARSLISLEDANAQ